MQGLSISGCFGYFCGVCLLCKNAQRLEEGNPLYYVMSCCIPVVPVFLLRQKLRNQHGIVGSTAEDAIVSLCCAGCANCQLSNEMNHLGIAGGDFLK